MSKKPKDDEIVKIYQKKTQLEHILLRPDTYIGSIEHLEQQFWVYDQAQDKILFKEIKYVPGLYKIFGKFYFYFIFSLLFCFWC